MNTVILPQDEQAHPVAVENINRALVVAFDMSGEAVRKHITAYAAKPRDKKALRVATEDASEAYKAYLFISHLQERIWRKYIESTLVVDLLNQLKQDIADQMDVDMMRTP